MTTDPTSTHDAKPPHVPATLAFTPDKYRQYVEDCDMTEAQQLEFLRTLWDIMATFVRLGFGVEAALPSLFQNAVEHGTNGAEPIPTHTFNVAADADGEKEE